jgi:hypothetical protein
MISLGSVNTAMRLIFLCAKKPQVYAGCFVGKKKSDNNKATVKAMIFFIVNTGNKAVLRFSNLLNIYELFRKV